MSKTEDLPNFLRLYEELDVRPDEGVARLTERYRARLRVLHPDTRGGEPAAAVSGESADTRDLGWLTRSYRAAVAFERDHGRLPGASGQATPAVEMRPLAGLRRTSQRAGPLREARLPWGAHWRWRWMLAATALALLLVAIVEGR